MTTITALTAALHGLSVAGVTRSYNHIPLSLSASDLPAKLIGDMESGRDSEYASGYTVSIGKTRVVNIIVCIQADGLDTPSVKTAAVRTMQDALETALDSYADQTDMRISYSTQGGSQIVGEQPYYAAIATVEALTN